MDNTRLNNVQKGVVFTVESSSVKTIKTRTQYYLLGSDFSQQE